MIVGLSAALIAAAAPAKLVIMMSDHSTVIDYATMERCERARAALLSQIEQESMSREDAAELERRLGRPVLVQRPRAYCIPG